MLIVASGTKSNQGRIAGRLRLNLVSRWTICTLARTSFTSLITPRLTAYSRFLNPAVWENCTNLQANVFYCVEAVGSISTYPGYVANTSATQAFSPTDCTALPWIHILDNYATTDPMKPLADGTRPDCYRYSLIRFSLVVAASRCLLTIFFPLLFTDTLSSPPPITQGTRPKVVGVLLGLGVFLQQYVTSSSAGA